jgi:MinD-like ATPase involved in chromosome partitioning or flagellar assembly
MKTYWTTFYSYKGGVGRSLALANVAALLVQRGHRVVLMDFDLEAPGLDTFSEFSDAKDKAGIVEYAAEFQRRQSAPDVTPFIHRVRLPTHLRGKLWIMPAGRKDKAYKHLLPRLSWAEIYESGLGSPFVENWKLSIEQEFQPDYVLIDSRTGLTEIGGVCTTAFPDLVVMLFGLNEQNVEGTAIVARHIREADLERPPQLHFVATPIPNLPPDKNGLLLERFKAAEEILGFALRANSLRYWPPAALTERLFVLDEPFEQSVLIQDHKMLCDAVTQFNRNGLDFLTEQTEQAIKADDFKLGERLEVILSSEFADRPEAFFLRSRLARLNGRSDKAIQLAEAAFELDPLYAPPFDFLCTQHVRAKQFEKVELLCERVLTVESRLPLERKTGLLTKLAVLRMSLGKYSLAADDFAKLVQSTSQRPVGPPLQHLVYSFNLAEASRRAGRKPPLEVWKNLVQLFESFPALSGVPTVTANHCQAMHIPYALVGDIEKSKDCLRKAHRNADAVNDLEEIFSVRDYREVSRDEFKASNEEFLAALSRGELWDGMKLPVATEGRTE